MSTKRQGYAEQLHAGHLRGRVPGSEGAMAGLPACLRALEAAGKPGQLQMVVCTDLDPIPSEVKSERTE